MDQAPQTSSHVESRRITRNHANFCLRARFRKSNHAQSRSITWAYFRNVSFRSFFLLDFTYDTFPFTNLVEKKLHFCYKSTSNEMWRHDLYEQAFDSNIHSWCRSHSPSFRLLPWLHDVLWPVFNVCFPCWTMSNRHLKAVWNLITGLPLAVG